jgi:hypothetical protein
MEKLLPLDVAKIPEHGSATPQRDSSLKKKNRFKTYSSFAGKSGIFHMRTLRKWIHLK